MTNTSGIPFIIVIMIAAVFGLIGIQAFWIFESIQAHNHKTSSSLKQAASQIKQEIEDDYFCFKLFKKINIEDNEYLTIIKSRDSSSFVDTLQDFKIQNEDNATSYPKYSFNYPIPVQLQIELKFDYLISTVREEMKNVSEISDFISAYNVGAITDTHTGLRVAYQNSLDNIVRENLAFIATNTPTTYALFDKDSERLIYQNEPRLSSSNELISIILYDDTLKFPEPYILKIYSEPLYKQIFISLGPFLLASGLITVILTIVLFYWLKTWRKEKIFSNFYKDIVHSVSHEMNTPILNIQLAVQTLQSKIGAENTYNMEYMKIINQENKRLAENVSLLLDYAQMEEGQIILDIRPVNVCDLLTQCVETFKHRIESLSGTLTFHTEELQVMVKGDETHLINVFCNLLDNAIKYSNKNPMIEIHCIVLNKTVLIKFMDNCTPIIPKEMKKVFEKYYRHPGNNTDILKGYGLGLYYVKLILEKQNGRIRLSKSNLGGNNFELLLPIYTP